MTRLIHVRTMHVGPEHLLVGVKVEFDASLDVAAVCTAIDDLEDAVRTSVPAAARIYVEPAVFRASGS